MEAAEARGQLFFRIGRDAILDLCNEDQLSGLVVITDREIVEGMFIRPVAPDHEFLAATRPVLYPLPAAFS
jgi:hypothetical protein